MDSVIVEELSSHLTSICAGTTRSCYVRSRLQLVLPAIAHAPENYTLTLEMSVNSGSSFAHQAYNNDASGYVGVTWQELTQDWSAECASSLVGVSRTFGFKTSVAAATF